MKNVLAEWSQGGGGRAGTALAHPPTTPIPQARPGVGYICGLWVLLGRYNSQSKHANADCAEFVFPLNSFFILSSIILWSQVLFFLFPYTTSQKITFLPWGGIFSHQQMGLIPKSHFVVTRYSVLWWVHGVHNTVHMEKFISSIFSSLKLNLLIFVKLFYKKIGLFSPKQSLARI